MMPTRAGVVNPKKNQKRGDPDLGAVAAGRVEGAALLDCHNLLLVGARVDRRAKSAGGEGRDAGDVLVVHRLAT